MNFDVPILELLLLLSNRDSVDRLTTVLLAYVKIFQPKSGILHSASSLIIIIYTKTAKQIMSACVRLFISFASGSQNDNDNTWRISIGKQRK